jgi:hypothetical protein
MSETMTSVLIGAASVLTALSARYAIGEFNSAMKVGLAVRRVGLVPGADVERRVVTLSIEKLPLTRARLIGVAVVALDGLGRRTASHATLQEPTLDYGEWEPAEGTTQAPNPLDLAIVKSLAEQWSSAFSVGKTGPVDLAPGDALSFDAVVDIPMGRAVVIHVIVLSRQRFLMFKPRPKWPCSIALVSEVEAPPTAKSVEA